MNVFSYTFSPPLVQLRVVRRFNGCECLRRLSELREYVLGFRMHLLSSIHGKMSGRVRFNADEGCGNILSCLFLSVPTSKPWLILGCIVWGNGDYKLVCIEEEH